ncbi:MAG TPA: DivIVA domain-containing protein [Actinomycetota bacterium]|nr:DivIVA domain-containing protein [Actinomycetota bacterium]
MRRKKGTEQDAPTAAGARITPEDVQQVEFRLAFRGYNERDVDAFLDRITQDLSAYIADGQATGGSGTGGPGAEEQQILARARAESDEILRRAREDAANIRAAASPGGAASADTRAAVAPFLNSEREFLQSLGSLVQTHAEEIKQMVMTLRAGADAAPEEPAGPRAVPEPPSVREDALPAGSASPPVEAAPPSEIRARLEAAGPARELRLSDEEAPGEPEGGPPVVVEGGTEPVYSTEGSPAGEQRERSLRELFWGED